MLGNKKFFKKSPIDRFFLSNTPEKRLAEIPGNITGEEEQMLDSGKYIWVLRAYSNEVRLVLKKHKHLYKSIEEHNSSLSEPFGVGVLNTGCKKYSVWQSNIQNELQYVDESEFCDSEFHYVKYVEKDGSIRILPSSNDSIRAWQKISRVTNKEIELYKVGLPLSMTEYVSWEEPVRYAKWGYSNVEGVAIETWPGHAEVGH